VNKNMSTKKLTALLLTCIILVVACSYLLFSVFLPDQLILFPFHHHFEHLIRLDPYLPVKTFFTLLNIGFLIPLIIIYARIYRNMPNRFTLGLLLIIIALLITVITASPFMVHLLGLTSFRDGPLQFVPSLFTTLALILLVKVSIE